MLSKTQILRAQIEQKLPSAFTVYQRQERGSIATGIAQIDQAVEGVPRHALTEICGSNMASSGKTSVLNSLLAQASRRHFCALVDAGDSFDPISGHAAGIHLPRLLWVRCGTSRMRLPPLEQAFKVTDILLQSGGFGLIAVNLSGVAERVVRKVPLSSWFRFSRVIEKFPAALVFVGEAPHATSCAGLVLRIENATAASGDSLPFTGNLLTQLNLNVEVVRGRDKKPAGSERYSANSLSLHSLSLRA
jgi:recombination protein RecA